MRRTWNAAASGSLIHRAFGRLGRLIETAQPGQRPCDPDVDARIVGEPVGPLVERAALGRTGGVP